MRVSARNQIGGTVVEVKRGATTSHLSVDIGGIIVTSSITNEAVDELGIKDEWLGDRCDQGFRRHDCGGLTMRAPFLIALLLFAVPAFAAEEPSGCDKFKWPIEHKRAALTAPDRMQLPSGSELAAMPATGFTLGLLAPAEAKLPSAPERVPKDGTLAGYALVKSAPKTGLYTISLSAGAWVDVVQERGTFSNRKRSAARPIARASARP